MNFSNEKKFGGWVLSLDERTSPLSEKILYFNATRDLNEAAEKILSYSWMESLSAALNRNPNYRISRCVNRIFSPEGEDMTEYLIFAVLASKKDSIKSYADHIYNISPSDTLLYSRVGLLIGVSEDNQVGLFGIRPYELFKSVESRPEHAKVLESLIVDRPDFWDNVLILLAADYDWSTIFHKNSFQKT
jgi:hypothetical protein